MLIASVFMPIGALYTLGQLSIFLLPLVGLVLGLELGLGVVVAQPGLPEFICTGLAPTMVAIAALLLTWTCLLRKIEVYFSSTPWLKYTQPLKPSPGGREYRTRCPFTGLKPTHRCPSCDCHVHSSAWHKGDRFTKWLAGDTVLRWEAAKASVCRPDLDKGRKELDQALDFCGNVYTNGVAASCIGCATWQKWLNLGSRRTLMMMFGACFFILAPWGFNSAYTGFWGKPLQIITEVVAVCWGGGALLNQVKNILCVNDFLQRHSLDIPDFVPFLNIQHNALVRWATKHLAYTPWETRM